MTRNHEIRRRLLHAAVACCALLASCGGGGNPASTLGAAGGTVAGPAGAQVVVPAGALAQATAVAVAQGSGGAPAMPAGLAAVGNVFAFTPHGTTFAVPAVVSVPFNAASVPPTATPVLYKTNAQGGWDAVAGASFANGIASASISSFSWIVVGLLPPQITQQPASATVLEPAGASFSVTALGAPPFTYQWQLSDDGGATWNAIAGATLRDYTTGATTLAADNGDRYRVLVGNADGISTSSEATLTVTTLVSAPVFTAQPANITVVAGADATFTAVASGVGVAYQWQRSNDGGSTWADVAGAINASFTLAGAQAADSGAQFRARASNGAATVDSTVATLTVSGTGTPPPGGLARIAAGSDFSIARLANGNMVSWGSDAAGTLGAGPGDQSRNIPGAVLISGVTAVAAGGAHALAVVGNSSGYRGWGYNGFGQLGDGSNQTREAPVNPTVNYPDAVEVCGGTLHSLIRLASGEVRAMGHNANGQLGNGSNTDSSAPPYSVLVSGIISATAIACRGNHSLALLADGTVRAWGRNNLGQLGDGTTTDHNAPTVVPGLTNVVAIAAGLEHSMALRSDGSVWAWGSNLYGMLGDGTFTNRLVPTPTLLTSQITAVAAGSGNSVALRADGVVLSWGINETGQLGNGGTSPGARATPAPVVGLTGVVAIAFSDALLGHGLAVKSDGTVWAWGDNKMGTSNTGATLFGLLGNGSNVPFSASPVQVTGLNLN